MKFYLVCILLPLFFFTSCENPKTFDGFTYPEGKYKALILSYDDGTIEDLQLVDLFNRNGLKGTFNLNSAYLGTVRGWPQEKGDTIFQAYIPRDSLKQIYARHEVAAHGAYHKDFINITENEILAEIQTDLEVLEELTGKKIVSMAYPFGNANASVVEVVGSTEIIHARTVSDTYGFDLPQDFLLWHPSCHDSRVLEVAEKYIQHKEAELSLFYVWGHSWEFNDQKRWTTMTEFCNRIGQEQDIWSAGAGEYSEYLKALDKVEFIQGSIYNPSEKVTVWARISNTIQKLHPGQKIAL
ncbi:MAG: polysaccharide deacetylase family protein [Flavobacteriaceae bacterium]